MQMAALSVAPEPEPVPEPEPEPVHFAGGGGIRAVVLYDYEVCSSSSPFTHLTNGANVHNARPWKTMSCP
jgi:hypothetical protein